MEYRKVFLLKENVKVVTNHYLTDDVAKPIAKAHPNSLYRYNKAYTAGEEAEWNMTPAQMRDALKAAKAVHPESDTSFVSIWSAVFEPSIKKVTYYFREDYTKGFEVTF